MVSYINTNALARVNKHDANNLTSNPIENEINIFHSLGSGGYDRIYKKEKFYLNEEYLSPREKYEDICKKQGIIARILDNIKNNIPILSTFGFLGSIEVENILERWENGELREFDAFEAVDKYEQNQKFLTSAVINISTVFVVLCALLSLVPLDVGLDIKIALICFTGGAIRLILEKLEKSTIGEFSEVRGKCTQYNKDETFNQSSLNNNNFFDISQNDITTKKQYNFLFKSSPPELEHFYMLNQT